LQREIQNDSKVLPRLKKKKQQKEVEEKNPTFIRHRRPHNFETSLVRLEARSQLIKSKGQQHRECEQTPRGTECEMDPATGWGCVKSFTFSFP